MSLRVLFLTLSLVAVLGMQSCTPKQAEEKKPEPQPTQDAPAKPEPPAPAANAAPAAPVPVAAADASLDPLQQKLVGTSWKLGDMEAAFLDGSKVKIKGGPIKNLMPDGLDAKYTFAKDEKGVGQIAVSALGQTKKGTWDGEKLIVDDTPGIKQ